MQLNGLARVAVVLGVVLLLANMSAHAHADRPNVVIILADDQGWGDLSIHGNVNLATPNLDSLERDGVSFERFYVSPVCSPTRAELLTGRYHPRTGVSGVSVGRERINLDGRTLADVLAGAGYATGAFGKWHNGTQWPYHPLARGFGEYYGFTSGHWGEYFDPPLDHNGGHVRGNGYIADDITDHAMRFIQTNRQRPFFCYIAYNIPHSPWTVPDEYWQRFKDKPITMRATNPDEENLDITRCALAMCENLDWNVGRVLKLLDELNLADDTIVVYFSDNGPNSARWNGGMKGRKGSTDEGGVRSPLFIRRPGKIGAGKRVEEICAAIDLMPTIARLSGVDLPNDKPLDGVDLSPLIHGSSESWPGRMIFSHHNGRVSVRTQRYRLDSDGKLYDMVDDPGQARDVASAHPDVAKELADAVARWRREVLADVSSARGNVPDDRPFPVGYREMPLTMLPARDGVPHGDVRRSSSAPNCSYFVNWTKLDDAITWDIEVNEPGEYEVTIFYTCPLEDAGATIELSFGDSRLRGRVEPGWDPPLYTNQDTLPRPPAESQMKEFRPMKLGRMRLEKGRGLLTLRALDIPGKQVMDVWQVDLRLVE